MNNWIAELEFTPSDTAVSAVELIRDARSRGEKVSKAKLLCDGWRFQGSHAECGEFWMLRTCPDDFPEVSLVISPDGEIRDVLVSERKPPKPIPSDLSELFKPDAA